MKEEYSDFSGILWVAPRNLMHGKFTLYAPGESNLESNVRARAYVENDLNASVTIASRKTSELTASLELKYNDQDELLSTIQAMSSEYVDATLEVRPHGMLFGIFDILEPPRITEKLKPSKDSTTRSHTDYKYINFGQATTIMVGKTVDEELRSYIDFDFSKYPKSLIAEKAKLRLYYSGTLSYDSYQLWTVDRAWDEDSITDANKPLLKKLVTKEYEINLMEGYIEFNILDTIQKIIDGSEEFYGFALYSDYPNLTDSFNSKESMKPPYLDFTYFDTTVWSIAKNELDATLFIYSGNNSDLASTLSVKTDKGEEDLDATLFVHRADTPLEFDIDSSVGLSYPEITATLQTAQTGYSDLLSRLTIRKDKVEHFEATVGSSLPELNANLFISYYDDVSGEFILRALDKSDLNSSLNISTPEIQSKLELKYRDDIDAELIIRQNIGGEFESSFGITQNELLGNVRARAYETNDLSSTLTIQQYSKSEVISKLAITQNELALTLTSRAISNSELSSTVTIRALEKDDLVSSVSATQNELTAKLRTMAKGDSSLEATLSIRTLENKEIKALMGTTQNELNVTFFAYSRGNEDLPATLSIRRTENEEMKSSLGTTNPELKATLIAQMSEFYDAIVSLSNPELNAKVQARAYKDEDMKVNVRARVIGANDLNAVLSTFNKNRSGAYYYIL